MGRGAPPGDGTNGAEMGDFTCAALLESGMQTEGYSEAPSVGASPIADRQRQHCGGPMATGHKRRWPVLPSVSCPGQQCKKVRSSTFAQIQ